MLFFSLLYVIILYGDFMTREDIKRFLVLAIMILLAIVAIKFFIAILPVIIIGLIALLIYDSYKRRQKNQVVKKHNSDIKEAEIIKEKNIE